MAVTPNTLKLFSGSFSCEADPRLQLFIDQAARRVDEGVFGEYYDDAILYLAAHLMTRDTQSNGGRGFVTNETVADLSRSYGQAGGILASGYGSTTYGQEFLKLVRLVQPTPMVV